LIVDNREQNPYGFQGLHAGADQGYLPIEVLTEPGTLKQGDYSLLGFEDRVAVERKSLSDLYSTLGGGRERFVRELDRLAELDFAAVVIEATWEQIAGSPPPHSSMNSRSVVASILAWQQRYPIAWLTAGSWQFGGALTYRILERFWLDVQSGKRTISASKNSPASGRADEGAEQVYRHCRSFVQ
jgi:hypothetical protein